MKALGIYIIMQMVLYRYDSLHKYIKFYACLKVIAMIEALEHVPGLYKFAFINCCFEKLSVLIQMHSLRSVFFVIVLFRDYYRLFAAVLFYL